MILQWYTDVKLSVWTETELYRHSTRSLKHSIDAGRYDVAECEHMVCFEGALEERSVVTKNYHTTYDGRIDDLLVLCCCRR